VYLIYLHHTEKAKRNDIMHHVLTYQVSGIEFDTGRHYQTTTTVGIENPKEAAHLINRWNRLSRSSTIT
jgi:hypothetical protein